MSALTLLMRQRENSFDPDEIDRLDEWIDIERINQLTLKAHALNELIAAGHPAWCPETHYRAEVMAGVRG